jgi:Aspartyl protease
MRRSTVFSFLSVVLLFGCAAGAQSTASNNVVPIKLYDGYLIVVRGSIGNLTKRNLAIDTGAYPSVVDRGIARKLHARGENEKLHVIEHNINTQTIVLPEIQVGPIRATHLRVISQDLTELSGRFGVRIDALIGLDVLAASSFRIDYGAKSITFGPVAALPYSAPLRWNNAHACVDLSVDGQPTHLLVDTGASKLLLFSARLPWLTAYRGGRRTFNNLGGSFDLREVSGTRLELAGHNVGPGDIYISDARNMDGFDFDGFLAAGALPFRQVAFDFEHQALAWEPARAKADVVRATRGGGTILRTLSASTNPSAFAPGIPGMAQSCSPDPAADTGGRCQYPLLHRMTK